MEKCGLEKLNEAVAAGGVGVNFLSDKQLPRLIESYIGSGTVNSALHLLLAWPSSAAGTRV